MVISKLRWLTPTKLKNHGAYLMQDRDAEIVRTSSHGLDERMQEAIETEHASHNDKSKNVAVGFIQSWPPNESGLYPLEKYNECGQELARRVAPGHLFWVVTHTDKDHIHNHIVICAVNSETGKRLENKKALLFNLRNTNDEIAMENGFSVLSPSIKAQEARLPEKARVVLAHGKRAWRYDLLRKAEEARSLAVSFDDYKHIMSMTGIQVVVEEKSISYKYGHRKGIRGDTVGQRYDREKLIEAFKENDERFTKDPALRERLLGGMRSGAQGEGHSLGVAGDLLPKSIRDLERRGKDYGKFTKAGRRHQRSHVPGAISDPDSVVANDLKQIQGMSIFDYCARNKIELTQAKGGKMVLKGREHIVVSEFGYRNTKNYTQGRLLDFVAYHDGTNFLTALAKIRENPRLLLLQPHVQQRQQTYRSFYGPKPERAEAHHAKKALQAFLSSRGRSGGEAETLLKSRNVHVGRDGSVWLLNDKDDQAMEFRPEPNGEWKGKRHSKRKGSFLEVVGSTHKLAVYRDPVDFFMARMNGTHQGHGRDSVFVMADDNSHHELNEMLAHQTRINEVHLMMSGHAHLMEKERGLLDEMKKRFNPFDIQVKGVTPSLDRSRGRGPDLGF